MYRKASTTIKLLTAGMALVLLLAVEISAQDSPADAENPVALSTLEVALWPEYDRPDMLVIYRGLLDEESELPAPVEFRIPARVGQPAAVAYVDAGGQRLNLEYTTRTEDDWLVVSFALPTRGFQLEYYDSLSTNAAGSREYEYAHTAGYSTDALTVDIQVPPSAEAFTLEPPADAQITESDGLEYYVVNAGSLAQGEERRWTITYDKADSSLTVESFAAPETTQPADAAGQTAAGQDISTIVVFSVAFVALLAVGGAAFWLGRRTQPPPPPPARATKRRGSGRGASAVGGPALPRESPSPDGSTFCYQCGTRLRSDSEFCHRCGAAVRET